MYLCVCVCNITYTCYMGILYMPNRIKSLTALPAFNSIIWMWVQHTKRRIVCDVDIVFEISRPASILYRWIYVCTCDMFILYMNVCYIYVSLHSRYLFVHVANFSIAASDFRSQLWKKQTKCNKQSELISQFCFNNNLEKCKRIFINQLIYRLHYNSYIRVYPALSLALLRLFCWLIN